MGGQTEGTSEGNVPIPVQADLVLDNQSEGHSMADRGISSPDVDFYEGSSKEAAKADLIFDEFYSPEILKGPHIPTTENFLFHPRLSQNLNEAIEERFNEDGDTTKYVNNAIQIIREINSEDAIEAYRGHHNNDYLQRIAELSKQVPDNFYTTPKPTIVIAARNEIDTMTAINSARNGYVGDFDSEINIIVYHNFDSTPSLEVSSAMSDLATLPNLAIVNERVPSYNTVGCAKKVASDIIIFGSPAEIDIPIIMMDADVKGLTQGIINVGIESLSNKMAASPSYNYGNDVKEKFPVLGVVWDVAEKLRNKKLEMNPNITKATIGPFTCTTKKNIALVGGFKPVATLGGKEKLLVAFEDMQFHKDLSQATCVYYSDEHRKNDHPVRDLGEDGYQVLLDPSREVESLILGDHFDRRWLVLNTEYYTSVSGTERFKWQKVDQSSPDIAQIPELASSITSNNLANALTNYFHAHIMDFLEDGATGNTISNWMLDIIEEMGYEAELETINLGLPKKGARPVGNSVEDIRKDSNWTIKRFLKVAPRKSPFPSKDFNMFRDTQ